MMGYLYHASDNEESMSSNRGVQAWGRTRGKGRVGPCAAGTCQCRKPQKINWQAQKVKHNELKWHCKLILDRRILSRMFYSEKTHAPSIVTRHLPRHRRALVPKRQVSQTFVCHVCTWSFRYGDSSPAPLFWPRSHLQDPSSLDFEKISALIHP